MDCGVSIINSTCSIPARKPRADSRREQTAASAADSSGTVTFGNVIKKFCGSFPPVFPSNSVRKMSSVRTLAKAILKINAEILHRLASKFFPNALIKCVSKPRLGIVLACGVRIRLDGFGKNSRVRRSFQVPRSRKLDRFRKRDKIRRVFIQRFQRFLAQPPRRVRVKQMRAAVNRVNLLSIASRPGIPRCERLMRALEGRENVPERIRGERPLHRTLQSAKQSDSMLLPCFRLNLNG